jgi:hypothetical protein
MADAFARVRVWVVLLALAATSAACGTSETGGAGGFNTARPNGASGDSDETPAPGADGPSLDDEGDGTTTPTGGGRKVGCSPDLRNVIDESGRVVTTCGDDQGCSAGKCVAACDAAAASKGNVGCDFVVATPAFYPNITPPCLAVFLANNWPKPVKIQVSRAGTSYDVTQFGRIPRPGVPEAQWAPVPAGGVPPGEVGVLFMSSDPGARNGSTPLTCPVPPALAAGTGLRAGGRGQAWRITTDVPVSGYDILPYGGARSFLPSATLLLPTSAWGTNYVAVLPPLGSSGPQWGQIVATEPDTRVQIVPRVAMPGEGAAPPAPANQVTSLVLGAGEFVQWMPGSGGMEISGSVISADKPIAFVGGNGYTCYRSQTSSGGGCDSSHQQVPPVAAFGSEYAVAPFTTRRANGQAESIPYRIVGAADGTVLTYDPPVNAPSALRLGQVIDFEATGPFVVRSQDADHPFFVAQVMPGCRVNSGSRDPGGCLGDEDYVNVLPPAQYLSKYVFFTDPTYPTTNLVLVRSKTPQGYKDVSIGCMGTVSGWRPFGSAGQYETTTVDLVRGGRGTAQCNNGPQVAQSEGPFGIVVWGLADAASYGYPAGGNVAPINTVVIPATPR